MSQKYIKSQNKNSHNAKSQLPRLFQVLVRLTTSTSNATRQCSNKFGIALAAYSVHKAFALRVNLDCLSAGAWNGCGRISRYAIIKKTSRRSAIPKGAENRLRDFSFFPSPEERGYRERWSPFR